MRLAWNCPVLNCDDRTITVAQFDRHTMSDFMQLLTLHAEAHELPFDPNSVIRWVAGGKTWWECDCGVFPAAANFEQSMQMVATHLRLSFHANCPYCHQGGLPLPGIYRAVTRVQTCFCGRALPKVSTVGGETETE